MPNDAPPDLPLDADIAASIAAGADPTDEQFRLLVENVSGYAIYLLDAQGRVASWNAGAERIKGYAAAEVLGRHFSLFYPPQERAAGVPERALREAEAEGRYHAEGWRLRKDGSRFWADVVISCLREPGGAVHFAKVTRDMTERRQALEQVQTREALLRGFTDNSPALMFIKDREGRYRFANRQFLEHFGVRADQVIGRTDLELFPRQQGLALAAHDAQVLAERRPVQTEETTSDFEGERTRVVVKFPVLDAHGTVAWVGGIVTDITERKRAEQALREQRTLLAEAQRVAGLGCWEWDPASGRITWSEELYRIYGLDPRSFTPNFEACLERVHPEDRQQVGAMVARALMDGRGFRLEERIVRADGAVRYLRSHGEVVRGEKGRPLKLLCASLDVTEQKDSEAALRAAAASVQALTRRLVEAEEAGRKRIARELHDRAGQSLSALNINLDIVLAAAGPALPPELQARLRDSLALVEGTLQAVENVMADLRPPLLDEYGLGAALGWHIEQVARRSGLAIALDDRAKEGIRRMHAEGAVALFRIAQEALNNVAKHAGATSVRVSLELEGIAEGAAARLTIADDGRGFTPGPPDPRAPRWGLTTMRERAEAVGGRIEFDSAPGRGTTLRASAPLGPKR